MTSVTTRAPHVTNSTLNPREQLMQRFGVNEHKLESIISTVAYLYVTAINGIKMFTSDTDEVRMVKEIYQPEVDIAFPGVNQLFLQIFKEERTLDKFKEEAQAADKLKKQAKEESLRKQVLKRNAQSIESSDGFLMKRESTPDTVNRRNDSSSGSRKSARLLARLEKNRPLTLCNNSQDGINHFMEEVCRSDPRWVANNEDLLLV